MTKNHQTCGVEHIRNAMAEFNMNQTELGRAFGMSDGFLSPILSSGKAPKWTLLAVECLRRRAGRHKDDVTLVIKVPGSKKDAVTSFLDALSIAASVV